MCMLFRTFSNLGPFLLFIENLVELLVLVNSLRATGTSGLSLTLFIFYRVIFIIVSWLSWISTLASGATLLIASVIITAVVSTVVTIATSATVVSASVATSLASSATSGVTTSTSIITIIALIFLIKLRLRFVSIACFVGIDIEAIFTKLLNIFLIFIPASTTSSDLLSLLSLLLLSLDFGNLLYEFTHLVSRTSRSDFFLELFFLFSR